MPKIEETGTPETGCNHGYKLVADKCVCDMNGTFALRQQIALVLSGVPGTEDLNGFTNSWSLVRAKFDERGELKLEMRICGFQTPEICSLASPLLMTKPEAHAEYVSPQLWRADSKPVEIEFMLPDALPSAAFVAPTLPGLLGMALSDPLGAWPQASDVEGGLTFGGEAVNGAKFVDADGDGEPGFTTYLVPPGGISSDAPDGPAEDYAADSRVCPRSDPDAPRSPYAYLPMIDGLQPVRIKRLFSGQRLSSELRGTLESCDRIAGDLTGADGGPLEMQSHIAGCVLAEETGDAPCSASLVSALNGSGSASAPDDATMSGSFVLMRVDKDTTCEAVPQLSFE